jgi:hypothetical protein
VGQMSRNPGFWEESRLESSALLKTWPNKGHYGQMEQTGYSYCSFSSFRDKIVKKIRLMEAGEQAMKTTVSTVIGPLIKRKIFKSEEEAVRELVKKYILDQISNQKREIARLEKKYGMSLNRFQEYLHERAILLQSGTLLDEQRRALGQAIMLEEDDYQDWQVATEIMESWLGLREEIAL